MKDALMKHVPHILICAIMSQFQPCRMNSLEAKNIVKSASTIDSIFKSHHTKAVMCLLQIITYALVKKRMGTTEL